MILIDVYFRKLTLINYQTHRIISKLLVTSVPYIQIFMLSNAITIIIVCSVICFLSNANVNLLEITCVRMQITNVQVMIIALVFLVDMINAYKILVNVKH